MTIVIREATLDDYPALCNLYAEVDDLHQRALPHIFQPLEKCFRSEDDLAKIMAGEDTALFVAEVEDDDSGVVGFVQVDIRQVDNPILIPRQLGWINGIVVGLDWQGCGIGRLLMAQAHRWLLDKDISEVQLNVWDFNQVALHFYESLGYSSLKRVLTLKLSAEFDKAEE